MGIKEVRVGTTAAVLAILVDFRAYVGEQLAVYLISLVCTMQTSPEIDSPACAPACGVIAFYFQSLGCGSSKFRSLIYRNLMEWIEPQQMRLMTVVPILVFPIVIPLHQIASLTDVVRAQAAEGSLQLLLIIVIDAQDFCSLDGVFEELADDGEVGGSTIETAATVALVGDVICLWRCTRGCNQFVWIVWIRDEPL